jgi:hypothetical protein
VAITLISLVQTTLLGGRYGSLIPRLAPHKSGLRLKRLVKISTTTGFRSNLAVISYGECRYVPSSALSSIYHYHFLCTKNSYFYSNGLAQVLISHLALFLVRFDLIEFKQFIGAGFYLNCVEKMICMVF